MGIKLDCPKCGKNFDVHSSLAGQPLDCSDCGNTFIVPSSAPAVESNDRDPIRKKVPKVPCPKCGAQYIVEGAPSKIEIECESCGHRFTKSKRKKRKVTSALPIGQIAGNSPTARQTNVSAGNPMVEDPKSGLTLAALLLGIGGIFTCGLTAVPAVICGHLAVRRSRISGRAVEMKTIVGMILGYLVIGVLVLGILAGLVSPDSKPVDRDHKEQVPDKPVAEPEPEPKSAPKDEDEAPEATAFSLAEGTGKLPTLLRRYFPDDFIQATFGPRVWRHKTAKCSPVNLISADLSRLEYVGRNSTLAFKGKVQIRALPDGLSPHGLSPQDETDYHVAVCWYIFDDNGSYITSNRTTPTPTGVSTDGGTLQVQGAVLDINFPRYKGVMLLVVIGVTLDVIGDDSFADLPGVIIGAQLWRLNEH
jgi:ribosomal protein L37AE/L43A